MNIDYGQVITAEQKQIEAHQVALAAAINARRVAYVNESDPLKSEAEYDALVAGTEPDYTAWVTAVTAIKERFTLPVDPNE